MHYGRPTRTFLLSALFACAAHYCEAEPANADEGLFGRWQLTAEHFDGRLLNPLAGKLRGTVHGRVHFGEEPPHAFVFDGNTKADQSIALTTDIGRAGLPIREITVEAWVRVDKAAEWGGFIGLLQDNGSYERGWLLGTRNAQFSFAVATAGSKHLTYLTSRRTFEPGYWYHVAGTYDGRVQRIYVDGELAGESKEQSGDIAYPQRGTLTVGAYRDDDEFYALDGHIEQASLWSRALAPAEIANRFADRKSRFPEIEPVVPTVADWPTYLRDNQRTGISPESLQFPLRLAWVHTTRHAPKPAWPAPAKHDYWHKKLNLQPRVIYDRAYHVVAVGDAVYFATSADDRVCCLHADTGHPRWSFFAEGPIRNAPTVAGGRVLFGSDDGSVYCLNSTDGSLLWKRRIGPSDRRIAGNQRIISVWPVRTGVLVDDGVAFACAGLFPTQGVYQAAFNVETGALIDKAPIDVSAQGYLERRAGRLYVATGRDPAGAFVRQLRRRGKGVGKELARFQQEYPYAFIGTEDARFAGGDGRVAAFSVEDGSKLWSAEVAGRAYSMAVARGRLFVSTSLGRIYCFTSHASQEKDISTATSVPTNAPRAEPLDRYSEAAQWILEQSNVRRGYCLVLNSDNGRLAYELARRSELQIVAVEDDPAKVAASRRALDAAGLYGRVVVHRHSPDAKLPYSDYLFNVVCSDSVARGAEFAKPKDEALRVLRPHGGVAVFAQNEEGLHRRGPLEGVGEWTHMYADAANTVCSGDQRVSGDMLLQWFGRPGPRSMIDRHHRTVAPLWKAGRLFVPGEDRVIAADAYNGTPLWEVEIPDSRRVVAFRDCSYMAVTGDYLYVAAGASCYGLGVETGEQALRFELPESTDKNSREWGYVACIDDLLLGSAQKKGAARRDQSYRVDTTVTYWDFIPVVCSERLFAIDRHSGTLRWQYDQAAGLIVNATLTAGDGKLFFIESANAATLQDQDGRAPLTQLLGNGSQLVALDLRSGETLWKKPHDLSALQHIVYASYAQRKLAVVGSKNSGNDKQAAQVQYDIHVFEAGTGERVWSTTQDQGTKIGGDHGEQDHHPVIVGERLYCEPFAYDLHSGAPLREFGWRKEHRRGCGNISASASTFFFRQSNPTMFDLATNRYAKVTTATRPGCWINIIPAGGLLLIPEGSSGCSCDYPVQTSLAFLPAGSPQKQTLDR